MADTQTPATAATRSGRRRPTIALTFDDGPHPESTLALLATLVAAGHRATFFVCGQQVEHHPQLLLALHEAGMWIGNHGYSHAPLTGLDRAAVAQELGRTQRIVRELTGTAPTLFRPPYGETDPEVRAAAAAKGLTEVLWTTDTRDWAGRRRRRSRTWRARHRRAPWCCSTTAARPRSAHYPRSCEPGPPGAWCRGRWLRGRRIPCDRKKLPDHGNLSARSSN